MSAIGVRRRIGHITPSSNTVLEPLTVEMSRPYAGRVSHHFTRVGVQDISLTASAGDQFAPARMLEAARLLGDAAVDAIVWNGTAGSWLGPALDAEMCLELERAVGARATTSTLALLEVVERLGVERMALAVPYSSDVAERIVARYASAGVEVVSSACLGMSVNREFAQVDGERLTALVHEADSTGAQCVAVVCTGLAAAPLAADLETQLGKPVLDSVAVTLWKALELVGIATAIPGWGALLGGHLLPHGQLDRQPVTMNRSGDSNLRKGPRGT